MCIRVLLADPDEILLRTYVEYLSRAGFQAQSAATGPDCLAKLRQWKPDLLVLEPDMPSGWGEKILEEVRLHPERCCAGVLILSRRDRTQLSDPVVREHHVKPTSMAQLARSIRKLFKDVS